MSLLNSTSGHKKHFTVTGYVVNKERSRLLLIHHKKLNKWLPPGGHLGKDELPHEAAIREVTEETGVTTSLVQLSEPDFALQGIRDMQVPVPYAMLYQLIPESPKDTEHVHLDMVYVLEADDQQDTIAQEREVFAARWLSKVEVLEFEEVFDSVKGFANLYLT